MSGSRDGFFNGVLINNTGSNSDDTVPVVRESFMMLMRVGTIFAQKCSGEVWTSCTFLEQFFKALEVTLVMKI